MRSFLRLHFMIIKTPENAHEMFLCNLEDLEM